MSWLCGYLRFLALGLLCSGSLTARAFASPPALPKTPSAAEFIAVNKMPRGELPSATITTWVATQSDADLSAQLAAPYADTASMLAAVFRHGGKADLARTWAALVATSRPERSALMQRAARSAGANPAAQATLLTIMMGDDLAASAQAASYLAERIEPYDAWSIADIESLATNATALQASKARGVAVAVLAGQCAHQGARRVANDALVADRVPSVRAAAVAVVECQAREDKASVVLALLDVANRRAADADVQLAAIARLAATVTSSPLTARERAALLKQFGRWRGAAAQSDRMLGLALALIEVLASDAHADTQRALIATLSDTWPSPLVGAAIASIDRLAPACPSAARVPLVRLAQSPFAELAMPASRAVAQCFPSR